MQSTSQYANLRQPNAERDPGKENLNAFFCLESIVDQGDGRLWSFGAGLVCHPTLEKSPDPAREE